MKVPTLFFCFLATLASLVFALPLQRRQFDTLQASQAKLDRDVAIFTNLVSDIGIVLDISISIQLGPILRDIIGDYQDCNSALQNNGKLSDSQAHDVIDQYRSSSSTFANGLNQMAARRRNSPFASVSASVNALGTSVSANMRAFGGNVARNSPNDNNGANQKEANDITSGLQNAIEQAFNN